MTLGRRRFLGLGGGAAAVLLTARAAGASSPETIRMSGAARGERVWFDPLGLAVPAGATLRFVNRDPGNSHTATAYHPALFERRRRIPAAASPWNSDFLLPGESFAVTLTAAGVYDYYCIPHEMAAMVGRIVVGRPGDPGWEGPAPPSDDIPPAALDALPAVDDILARGRIRGDGP